MTGSDWWLGISKTAALVGCPHSAVVSVYQKWSKKGAVLNQCQNTHSSQFFEYGAAQPQNRKGAYGDSCPLLFFTAFTKKKKVTKSNRQLFEKIRLNVTICWDWGHDSVGKDRLTVSPVICRTRIKASDMHNWKEFLERDCGGCVMHIRSLFRLPLHAAIQQSITSDKLGHFKPCDPFAWPDQSSMVCAYYKESSWMFLKEQIVFHIKFFGSTNDIHVNCKASIVSLCNY